MLQFEFDPAKSGLNKEKHGIDFEQAQALWADDRLLLAPARTEDEPRMFAIGRIGVRHWSAVFIMRDGRVRLISVRRSRDREIEYYEGA